MSVAAVGVNSQALWYMTRGFGLASLILLTVTTALGLSQAVRYARPGTPRFVIAALHKNASLLAVAAIAVHVVTAVLDTFAPIHLIDVFIPYASQYRPFWTGMGALALDLMLAVIITSLLRERIGYRVWRTVHWAAYLSWPVALVHGLGTGSDSQLGWVLFVYVICTLTVVAALWWRLATGWASGNQAVRGTAVAASIVVPLLVAVWAAAGPLHTGWARRAGTPASLLSHAAASGGGGSGSGTSNPGGAASPGSATLTVPLTATLQGTQSESGPDGNGLVSVTISGTFRSGQPGGSGDLRLVLTGQPADGGVSLTGSQLSLGPASNPNEYTGHVSRLAGTTVVGAVQTGTGQQRTVTIQLRISESGRVLGQVGLQ
ncbi:MAG TPA: ferric reductase-like transmembrane domain-containing protein [Acidimicrobiales bacterium]|nr:ferric reductase-like transmembrane domain-containing protein [Acidimicrobiales bacterium]